jgi:nitrate reductase cytochrome c-type subunit
MRDGLAWSMLNHSVRSNPNMMEKESHMKKVMSTIVAALVAVSFAGLVFAQDAPAPAAAPAAGEVKKEEKAPAKKHKKMKKTKKAAKKTEKKEEAPAAAPVAAPAAK